MQQRDRHLLRAGTAGLSRRVCLEFLFCCWLLDVQAARWWQAKGSMCLVAEVAAFARCPYIC